MNSRQFNAPLRATGIILIAGLALAGCSATDSAAPSAFFGEMASPSQERGLAPESPTSSPSSSPTAAYSFTPTPNPAESARTVPAPAPQAGNSFALPEVSTCPNASKNSVPGTPKPRPSSKAPTLPTGAKESSTDGATVAVQHFLDVYSHGLLTKNATRLRQLYMPSCRGCETLTKSIEELDGWVEIGFKSIPQMDITSGPVGRMDVGISTQVVNTAWRSYSAEGVLLGRYEKDVSRMQFHLEFRNGSWRVTKLVLRSE